MFRVHHRIAFFTPSSHLLTNSTSLLWRGRKGGAFEVRNISLGRGQEGLFAAATTKQLSFPLANSTKPAQIWQSNATGRLLMKTEAIPCSTFSLLGFQRRFFSLDGKLGGEAKKGKTKKPKKNNEKEKMSRVEWLKERLGVSDEDLMKILFNKPFLFDQPKEELEGKVDYLEKELGLTIKEIVVVLMRSVHDLQLEFSDWRKYTDFLKSHYGFTLSHLKKYFVNNQSTSSLLSDAIMRNCVARKMIFEDLYGEGIFSKKTGVSITCVNHPFLLIVSPERLIGVINALLKAANQNSLSKIRGLCEPTLLKHYPEGLFWKYCLLSSYFQGSPYREPLRGEGWEYHLAAGRYEERQREIDIKYGIESCSQDDDSLSDKKASRVENYKEEEMRLFEDYQTYLSNPTLVGNENRYVKAKKEEIEWLLKENFPSFLKSADEEFMEEFVDVLHSHNWNMEMFIGRLWEASEGLKFDEDDILSMIANGHLLTSVPSNPMKRIGSFAVLFTLSPLEVKNAARRYPRILSSSAKNLLPKITIICDAFKEKAILQGYYEKDREEVMTQLRGLVGKEGISLDDMISIYRKHPVMRDLIELIAKDSTRTFMSSRETIKKSLDYWRQVEYTGELSLIIRSISSRIRKDLTQR